MLSPDACIFYYKKTITFIVFTQYFIKMFTIIEHDKKIFDKERNLMNKKYVPCERE